MKKILCLTLAALMLLSLAACGGNGLGNGASAVGEYRLSSMEQQGMAYTREDLLATGMTDEQLDSLFYLEITAVGEATILLNGGEEKTAYDATSMWPVDDPEDKVNCTITGNTVTLEMDGVKVVFTKK